MLAIDKRGKGLDMSRKRSPSQISDGITRVGFTSDKAFFAADVAQVFETAGMAGEVAIGEFEQRLHRGKVDRFVGHQHRHDAKPDLAFESLVQTVQVGNHGLIAPFVFYHEEDPENDVQQPETEKPSQQGIIDHETVDETQYQFRKAQIAQLVITEMAAIDKCQAIENQCDGGNEAVMMLRKQSNAKQATGYHGDEEIEQQSAHGRIEGEA